MHIQKQQIIERLFTNTNQSIKLGLERIREVSAVLGDPHTSFHSIHVAGTNGKGSVCTFLESIARSLGLKTGLYTSPHILNFEERFLINGKPALENDWIDVYTSIEAICEKHHLTFFEITTLLAFELFKRHHVQYAIIETGLGGRLDATNIIHPRAAVITSIALDHMNYLGTDIISIASEKCGIIKKNTPLIMIEHEDRAVMDFVLNKCSENNAPMSIVKPLQPKDICISEYETSFSFKKEHYSIGLAGNYQVTNAICSLTVAESLGLMNAAPEGLSKAFIPGRFQRCSIRGKKVIFDVSHNPQAIEQFLNTLNQYYPHESSCIITGMMSDKDYKTMLSLLVVNAKKLILTKPQTTRAALTQQLYQSVSAIYTNRIQIIESVSEAIQTALSSWDGLICVTGSFFTVSEAMAATGTAPFVA